MKRTERMISVTRYHPSWTRNLGISDPTKNEKGKSSTYGNPFNKIQRLGVIGVNTLYRVLGWHIRTTFCVYPIETWITNLKPMVKGGIRHLKIFRPFQNQGPRGQETCQDLYVCVCVWGVNHFQPTNKFIYLLFQDVVYH